MKSAMHLVHLLIPLLCAMQAANAFVARGPSQLLGQRQLQRDYRVLFQEPPTLEKEAAKTEDAVAEKVAEPEEEMTETQKLMKQVKEAGTAGVLSYALWELGFWALSVPVCAVGYYKVTGHWPNLSDPDDQKKLGAEAFAFVNFARFAVPLRIGLALSTTPWIDENIVKRFLKKEGEN
mmetsp:Transcript_1569/g.3346  ORF Transcript_1569/g.3346 Transcript_1569/m.3346 type:complete len:178 (+) Transcript_1569:289-822(+)